MRGAATQAMSDIVEERQQSRYAPFAAAPLRAAAPRPAAKCEVISARALRRGGAEPADDRLVRRVLGAVPASSTDVRQAGRRSGVLFPLPAWAERLPKDETPFGLIYIHYLQDRVVVVLQLLFGKPASGGRGFRQAEDAVRGMTMRAGPSIPGRFLVKIRIDDALEDLEIGHDRFCKVGRPADQYGVQTGLPQRLAGSVPHGLVGFALFQRLDSSRQSGIARDQVPLLHQIERGLAHLCIGIDEQLQEEIEEFGEVSYFFIHPGQFQCGTTQLGTAVDERGPSFGDYRRVVAQRRLSCKQLDNDLANPSIIG